MANPVDCAETAMNFDHMNYCSYVGSLNYIVKYFKVQRDILSCSFLFLVYVEQGRSTTATTLTFTTASTSGITWKAKVSQVGNICFLSSLVLSKSSEGEIYKTSAYAFGQRPYFLKCELRLQLNVKNTASVIHWPAQGVRQPLVH